LLARSTLGIAAVDVAGAPQSYMAIVEADTHETPPERLIPGVLKHFDVPDVKRAIAPRLARVRSRSGLISRLVGRARSSGLRTGVMAHYRQRAEM
jgi:hypothetical protein